MTDSERKAGAEMSPANLPGWKLVLAIILLPIGILDAGIDAMLHLLAAEHYCMFTGHRQKWTPRGGRDDRQ